MLPATTHGNQTHLSGQPICIAVFLGARSVVPVRLSRVVPDRTVAQKRVGKPPRELPLALVSLDLKLGRLGHRGGGGGA